MSVFERSQPWEKLLLLAIAALSWISAVWISALNISWFGLREMMLLMSGYFTYWTLIATAIAFSLSLRMTDAMAFARLVGATIIMNSIMLVMYWKFSGVGAFIAAPFPSKLSHSLIPGLVFLYVFRCVSAEHLRFRDAFGWTALPILYTLVNLFRRAVTGVYAYPQTDVGIHGYAIISLRIVLLSAATVAVGACMIEAKKRAS